MTSIDGTRERRYPFTIAETEFVWNNEELFNITDQDHAIEMKVLREENYDAAQEARDDEMDRHQGQPHWRWEYMQLVRVYRRVIVS